MSDAGSSTSSSPFSRTLLTAGLTAAGAYAGLTAARWWHRQMLPPPSSLPPALDWETRTLETRDGPTHCYVRPGTGTPIVLLHSFNAAASTFELKPIAEHLAETSTRPLYAIDWLGFGRSGRPAIRYTPDVYAQQLFQVLTDLVESPADLVALSLGCEYAAWMGLQASPYVRRLALISPTGLSATRRRFLPRRLGLALVTRSGLFELLFYRLIRRGSLQSFYERQVFLRPDALPDALLEYAQTTAHAKGGHYAPQAFVEGSLFLEDAAREIYSRLYRPTLLLTPETPGPTIQQFDLLPSVLDYNSRHLTHESLPGGLLPHWEAPAACLEVLDAFLDSP